ncbi:MAG: STAS domain-containing protein [Bacteroidia bacterium]|nr:STAS domain-containing protein [Bacteroidia bacterium]
MKTIIVQLSLHFDRSISTRVAVQNLFSFDKRGVEEIVFDFSDIHFISSSASHQFVMEVKELEKLNISVSYSSISDDIEKMFCLAKTDRKNIFTVQEVKHLNVLSNKDLSSLLLEV